MNWAETVDGRWELKWGTYTLAELRAQKKFSWGAYDYTLKTTDVFDVYVLGYRLNSYVGLDAARDEATKTVKKEVWRLVETLELMK